MFLQILPSDIDTTVETVIINKAEIISLALLTTILGLFLVYKIVKAKKPKLILRVLLTIKMTLIILDMYFFI